MNTPARRLAALALFCIVVAALHHLLANSGNVQPFTLSLTGLASQKLTWTSIPGARYVVQVSHDLGGWTDVDVVTATGTTTMWNDPYPRPVDKGFYRLVTPQLQVTAVHPMVLSSTDPTTVYFTGECFDGTELFFLNGTQMAGLVFDSTTQLHITLPAEPVGIYELKITDTLNNPLDGGIVTVTSNLQGLRAELPPVNPPAAPTSGAHMCTVGEIYGATVSGALKNGRGASPASWGINYYVSGWGMDPIWGMHPANGENRLQTSDLFVSGVGLDFTFTRTYRSRLGTSTPMGEGWDHGYNIRAQKVSPTSVTVLNGDGRADVFTLGTGGVFECPERFESGALSGGGTVFTLTFPGGGKWEFGAFGALPGPANEARVSAIRDRNNNAITFTYDLPTGRLTTITDTVGHAYTLTYDPAGYIATLTDFAGRVVTYTHDAAGDLTVVRSPAVVGTPNGNDFPAGKTVSYTYSSGFGDPRLNHNLLTITDGLGQTPVVFTYAATLVPTDVEFDRVERVRCGTPGQDIVLTYERLTPSPANLFSVVKTYVNDRNGHLTEYEYDSLNRPVRTRRYTGACLAGVAVTAGANRPGSPLRPGDPAFFETTADWNRDSLCTKKTMPRGNTIEYFHEMDLRTAGSVPARKKARLLLRRQRADVLGVYDQDEIVTRYVHDDRFGAGRRVAFPTQVIDGRGYGTQMGYDVKGNLLSVDRALALASPAVPAASVVQLADYTYNAAGQCTSVLGPHNGTARRLDTFTYYGAGPQAGWLASVKVNDGGLTLTTQYEYNVAGALVRTIDPRGNDSLITRNALNQPVRVQSRNAAGAGRGHTDIFYDANNNVVRTDVANKDQNGVVQPNAEFTSTWTYDILNCPVDRNVEIDAITTATTRTMYDAERNVTDVLSPLAVAGTQPTNTVHIEYDERNFPYRSVLAAGDPAQSTTQYDYDANANCTTCTQGLEGTPLVWKFDTDPFSKGDFEEPLDPNYDPETGGGIVPAGAGPGGIERMREAPGIGPKKTLKLFDDPPKPKPNPFLIPDENFLFRLQGRSGSLVAINESCSPIHRLASTEPGLFIITTGGFGTGGGGFLWDPPIGDGPIPPTYSGGVDTSGWLIDPERPAVPMDPIDFGSGSSGSSPPGSSGVALPLPFPFPGERHEGLPPAPPPPVKKDEEYKYDALSRKVKYHSLGGRPTTATDPMGNTVEYHYDAAGNRIQTLRFGEQNDVPGSGGNVRLGESTVTYDPLNRPVTVNTAHFNPATAVDIGDGQRTTTLLWTDSGALKTLTDDRGNNTNWFFDTAGRATSCTDAKGNVTARTYDGNGNVTSVTSTEKSDLGSPDQVFITTFAYDARDHCTSCVDGVGNTNTYAYDSRGFPRVHVNARGVADVFLPDGRFDVTLQYRDMDGSGTLTPPDIQRTMVIDLNTRPVSITDDNGHATQYQYDALNRRTRITLADATQTNFGYDVHHNVTAQTDANGTQILSQFDRNNRPVMRQVIPGAGISPTTQQQTFSYDGRGLVVAAMTSGTGFGGPIMHQCALAYDSHGNVISDTQDGLTAASIYDGVGNRTQLVHPTGRVVNYTYDSLNRPVLVHDGAPVAQIFYIGSCRTERIANGNGTRTDYTWDGVNGVPNPPGDFGFRKIIRKAHTRVSDGLVSDDHSFKWDPAQNKIERKDNRAGGPQLTHTYGYDNDDRLIDTNVTNAVAAVVRHTTYQIDGANNRVNVGGPGTPDVGAYVMNAGAPTFDAEVNQYTATPIGPHTYKAGGETVAINGAQYFFDFAGALVGYQPAAAPQPAAVYEYDALGRRVKRTIDPAGAAQVTTFGYVGGALLTENPAAGVPKDYLQATICDPWDVDVHMTSISSPFGDDFPLMSITSPFGDDFPIMCIRGPVNAWLHHDDLGNTTALSDAAGAPLERVEYADYGLPQLFNAGGAPIGASIAGNPWLFGLGYFNAESGLIDAKPAPNFIDLESFQMGATGGGGAGKVNVHDIAITKSTNKATPKLFDKTLKGPRTMNPKTGRWLTNDPFGTWGDPPANGNGKDFRGCNPWSWR